jgi:hypothetical protein
MRTSHATLLFGLAMLNSPARAEELSYPLSEKIASARDARVLDLGAGLGRDRLKAIAWAERGEIVRLRVPLFEESKPAVGTYFDMPVLSRAQMAPKVLLGFQGALLDESTYERLGLGKPIPGRGAGKLCGGFQPTVGLRFALTDGRTLDVLVSFTCYDLQFRKLTEDPLHSPKPPLQGATDKYGLTRRGIIRLLKLSSEALPADQGLKKQLEHWKGAAGQDAVQQGVGPAGRSPAAPARRSTP